jgi:hypothetical protein
MLYLYFIEYDVGNINLIMNFEVSYLILANCIPVALMIKTSSVYAKIESDNLGSSNRFGSKHNQFYHLIYNCQSMYIGIAVLRIITYLFLVIIFLFQS